MGKYRGSHGNIPWFTRKCAVAICCQSGVCSAQLCRALELGSLSHRFSSQVTGRLPGPSPHPGRRLPAQAPDHSDGEPTLIRVTCSPLKVIRSWVRARLVTCCSIGWRRMESGLISWGAPRACPHAQKSPHFHFTPETHPHVASLRWKLGCF